MAIEFGNVPAPKAAVQEKGPERAQKEKDHLEETRITRGAIKY